MLSVPNFPRFPKEEAWSDIAKLWLSYNTHLAMVIRYVGAAALRNGWKTPRGQESDLQLIMQDLLKNKVNPAEGTNASGGIVSERYALNV